MPLSVPSELSAAAATIESWAREEPLVSGVFIFGSRLRQTNRCDSDLDVAVAIEACSESEVLLHWTGNKSRWVRDLTSRVGLTIDLDIAHPGIAPKVWSYLRSGSAEIYKRTDCDKAAT